MAPTQTLDTGLALAQWAWTPGCPQLWATLERLRGKREGAWWRQRNCFHMGWREREDTRKKYTILAGSKFHFFPLYRGLLINPLRLESQEFDLFFLFVFLRRHPRHMDVSRLGVESELQMLAYITATARPDPSRICNLHHSSWQCQILNPLSKARDRTCILMNTSRVR